MRRALLAAILLASGVARAANVANVFVLDTTAAFEDIPGRFADEDQNDVVLHFNARCREITPSGDLVHEEIHFTPVAAGANKTNALWLGLPGTPSRVTLAEDGGAPATLCDGTCSTAVELLTDFGQAFVNPPPGFVNTQPAGSIATAHAYTVYAEYTTYPSLGSVTCPNPDFQVRRPSDAVVIDGASTLEDGMPMRAELPGDWEVPNERTAVSTAYPDFLTWLQAEVAGCAPGSCPQEDWYTRPDATKVIARSSLATTAPIVDAATCSDLALDQDETDVDCGGGLCAACVQGQTCSVGPDCATGSCVGGVCAAPTCTDDVENGDETDVDCGGPTCGACANGLSCATVTDCTSGLCGVGGDGTCGSGTCFDGAPDPDGSVRTCVVETGIAYEVRTWQNAGSYTFTPSTGVTSVEALIVGGGGGGGGSHVGLGGGGGGGGGGLRYLTGSVTPGSGYPVVVGAGGVGGSDTRGSNGGSTSLLGYAVLGGGGGGSGSGGAITGAAGGSGGGAGYNGYNSTTGGAGRDGQGYAGGNNLCTNESAGGGGAGGAGVNSGTNTDCGGVYGRAVVGGSGGPGVTFTLSGASRTYAEGGSGTGHSLEGVSATPHTGNGGNGTYASASGGKGGNGSPGVALVRYPAPLAVATCGDGVLDGYETDVDCGGPYCGACADGLACETVTDCSSGFCGPGNDGTCGTAVCFDGAAEATGAVHTCTEEGGVAYEVESYSTPGNHTFIAPPGVSSVDVLLVAGGGGGGGSQSSSGGGGGGGAGGLRYLTGYAVAAGSSYPVTVGSGGAGGYTSTGGTGGNSVFDATSALGGGGGGSGNSSTGPTSGGSGGGAGYLGYQAGSGASGVSGQGFAGGDNQCSNEGAGGGGAGGPGENQGSYTNCGSVYGRPVDGGLGGRGLIFTIIGVPQVYAEGGRGGYGRPDDVTPALSATGDGGWGTYGGANGDYGMPGASGNVVVRFLAR